MPPYDEFQNGRIIPARGRLASKEIAVPKNRAVDEFGQPERQLQDGRVWAGQREREFIGGQAHGRCGEHELHGGWAKRERERG